MKKIISILLAMMLLVGIVSINAFAAGGISVSTGSISLKPGDNASVTASASNCAGLISVSSSNPSVATVSASTDFLDSEETPSATISISAKAEGTAVITVTATDMTTYDEEDISGQARSITVTVAAPVAPATTTTAPKKTDNVTKETVTKKTAEKAELGSLKVIANNDVAVAIVPGTYDYDIKVPYGTKSLTVDASALDDATVEVVGNDNISDGSVVNINVTSKDGTKTVYSVKVSYEEPQVKKVIERNGVSKGLVIIIALALFFLGLIIGLLLGFLIGKKKFENVDYFGGDDGYNGGFVSGSADDDGDGVVSPFQTSGFNFESAGGMGLNYDFANDDFEDSADDDAVSLRDPVYAEPEAPVVESADEPSVNVPPVAPVIPVAEPVAAPAPVVEPAPAYTAPEPAYAAPTPAYAAPAPAYAPAAPVEPVAPVAEPAPTYVAPEPAYAAPVAEPVAPAEPQADLSSVIAPNPAAQAPTVEPTSYAAPVAPVAEPTPAEPVSGLGLINSALGDAPAAPVAEPVAPVIEPVAPVAEPVAPVAEPVAPTESYATPYVDDAPPVLPYEAGTAFGSIPFEQSAD